MYVYNTRRLICPLCGSSNQTQSHPFYFIMYHFICLRPVKVMQQNLRFTYETMRPP